MASNPPAQRNGAPNISEETVKEMIAVQKQTLTIKLKELERDSAEIEFNKKIAQSSIDAQERDRKHEREENTKRQSHKYYFGLAIVILIFAFSAYALHLGRTDILMDVLKVVVGFVGGLGFATYKTRSRDKDDDE